LGDADDTWAVESKDMPNQGGGTAPEGRIRRSWRLTGVAWDFLRRDRTMIAIATLGTVTTAGAWAAALYLGGYFEDPTQPGGHLALVGAIAAFPITFIAVFLNVALVCAAAERMRGGRLSMGEALAAAATRLGPIAVWTLLSVGVGLLLQQIASRIPGGGRILMWLAGAAWTLATIFVVPVLVVESAGAIPAVRRSASLIKQRWGEGIAGSLTIGAWLIVAAIPACVVLGAGVGLAHSEPGVASVLIVVGAVGIVAIAAAASAMREIFALALYCYAVDGEVRVFAPGDLDRPFSARGKRVRNRD
jgi:hypothetical protein